LVSIAEQILLIMKFTLETHLEHPGLQTFKTIYKIV
jgi:hypothetical protein